MTIKKACQVSERKIKARLTRKLSEEYAGDPVKLAQAKNILAQLGLVGFGGDILIAGKRKGAVNG